MKRERLSLYLGIFFYIIGAISFYYFKEEQLSLIPFIISYIIVGKDVLLNALQCIKDGQVFNEYFLMSLATIGAFVIGEYPEAVAVMLFYNIGELFEHYAVGKSRRSIAEIMAIRPEFAMVERDGEVIEVDPDEVHIGEIIQVRAGERIPLDGIVIEGTANLDTSALTGEAVPENIKKGSEVNSGCVDLDGLIRIQVTKVFGDSTVNRILEMVEMAAMRKSKTEQFISKFARYYTPVVVIGALFLALVPNFFEGFSNWQDWLNRALIFLVVSCPCALVISVPLSFFGGIGGASKQGILVKGSNYLEALAEVEAVVFDKTGTITKGLFQVKKVEEGALNEPELIRYLAHIESFSNHPLAKAVVSYYKKPLEFSVIKDLKEISGRGIQANMEDHLFLCGNDTLMKEYNISIPEHRGKETVIYLAMDGIYAGSVYLSDEIKEDIPQMIRGLKSLGVKRLVMLTGDKREVAEAVGEELGLNEFYGSLLPLDKVNHIEELLEETKGKVAFVGDGINDAPVLARADIGVAMGAMGSDAAIEAADLVIMDDAPSKLVTAIEISRNALTIAKQNTIFAIGIKVFVLLLSALGLANLWLGVFADVGVTVLAILNALRSLYYKPKETNRLEGVALQEIEV